MAKPDLLAGVPLHNLEMEQALLGALLLRNPSFDVVAGKLDQSHFFEPLHQVIFQEIARKISLGEPATPLTIRGVLPPDMDIAGLSGNQYLARLAAHGTIALNVPAFADTIMQLKAAREHVFNARDLFDQCLGGVPVDEALKAFNDISEATRNGFLGFTLKDTSATIEETMYATVERMTAAIQGTATALGIPTGVAELDKCLGGFQRGNLVVIAGRPGMGKQQPVDTPVLTPTGWRQIGAIRPGDLVIGRSGWPTKVLSTHPQGVQQAFRVTFRDLTSTECGENHLWCVAPSNSRSRLTFRVMSLSEIRRRGVATPKKGNRIGAKWRIPLCEPIQFQHQNLPLHPYVLGVLIGDGALSGNDCRFSNPDMDEDIRDLMRAWLPHDVAMRENRSGACPYFSLVGDGRKELRAKISMLGLDVKSGQKFIPPGYMVGSVEQRLELLRGLMDTDGSCRFNKTHFYSTSVQLAEDVAQLVRSLGGLAVIRSYDRTKEGKTIEYAVTVKMTLCPFHTVRKASHWRPYFVSKYIHAIESSRLVEQVCITVDASDGLYITNDFIVTHNSSAMVSIGRQVALHGYGVGIQSLEMDKITLGLRFITDHAYDPRDPISYNAIMKAQGITEQRQQILTNAARALHALPIEFDFATSMTVAEVAGSARRMASRFAKSGRTLDVLMIDYLKFIKATARYAGQKHYEIGEITSALKGLARQMNCCIVLFHQLNREVEKTGEKRPGMEHLRESGDVEQDADVIILLFREGYYIIRSGALDDPTKSAEAKIKAEACAFDLDMIVAKQRMGPAQDLKVFCDITTSTVRSREAVQRAFVHPPEDIVPGAPDLAF